MGQGSCGRSALCIIKLDRWPKIQNVTPSHSLLVQLYGPKSKMWRHHSLLGQLYGPKRDQKLFKNSNKVKKLLKNSKNRKCDGVTFLIGSTLWPKSWQRDDDVTFLIWSTLWPKNVTKNCSKTAVRSKNCSKTVKTENVTASHSLLGQLYGPKSRCDAVTFLIGSTFWPKIYVANSVITSKNGLFPDGVTWRGHRSNLLR